MPRISSTSIQKITDKGKVLGLSQEAINIALERAAEEVSEGRLEEHVVRSAFSMGISDGGIVEEGNNREMAMKAEIVGILRSHAYLSFEGPPLDTTCENLAEKILAAVKRPN